VTVPLFDSETDPALRQQILTYASTSLMTDRERAKVLGLPAGCRLREGAKILAPEKLVCGEHVFIGEGAILDAQGGLSIGANTQIGLYVLIWTHSSHWQALRGETGQTRQNIVYRPTSIGERCFIGGPSVIAAGVTIGNRVIVPPMSVVEEDLPDGTVYESPRRSLLDLRRRVDDLEKRLLELASRTKEG
jgi:acetyltransferase-like isoleucine patch superfamily enzyme